MFDEGSREQRISKDFIVGILKNRTCEILVLC